MRAEATRPNHRPDGTVGDVSASLHARVASRFLAGEGGTGEPAEQLARLVRREQPLMGAEEVDSRVAELVGQLLGMGPLEALLEDPSVTDVLINGPGEVYLERHGVLGPSGLHVDAEAIDVIIERLVTPLGLRADRAHPIVDARRPDGTRVSVVLRPVAPDGPIVAIRRHRLEGMGLDRFGDEQVCELLTDAVGQQANIVVHGATGSGKTTLLNALVALVAPEHRVILIEDTSELLAVREGVVRLEARQGDRSGGGRVTMGELVRAALRLRPDRIVVGEVRGAEASDMVWALSTGHRGSMSTIHARGARDALARLEVMVAMGLGSTVPRSTAGEQVRRAVDVVVGVERGPRGHRRVTAIHRCDDDGRLHEVIR